MGWEPVETAATATPKRKKRKKMYIREGKNRRKSKKGQEGRSRRIDGASAEFSWYKSFAVPKRNKKTPNAEIKIRSPFPVPPSSIP